MVMEKQPGLDRDGMQLCAKFRSTCRWTSAFAGVRRRIAYERLLLDFIEGDPTLFVRRDEVEAQWEWIDAIRDGWASHQMRPRIPMRRDLGPPAASTLTEARRSELA